MRFIPTSHRFSILWVAWALLAAAAPPAEAWQIRRECYGAGDVQAFRQALVDSTLDRTKGGVRWFGDLIAKYRACRASQPRNEDEIFNRCLQREKDYLAILEQPGLGLIERVEPGAGDFPWDPLSNDEYKTRYEEVLKIPDCLKNITLFTDLQATNLSNIDSVQKTVTDIKRFCPDPKTIVLPYVSPGTPSIDNTQDINRDRRGRIVVWVGENNISHYVQFSVNANRASTGAIQRVQASVVKVSNGAYIFDWKRSRLPTVNFDYDRNFGNNLHCYGCHWNGVLAIHPFQSELVGSEDVGQAARTLGRDSQEWLDLLNQAYQKDAVDMNKQIDADWAGPQNARTPTATVVVGAPTPRDLDVVPREDFPDPLAFPSNVGPPPKACTDAEYVAILDLRPKGSPTWTDWRNAWSKSASTLQFIWNQPKEGSKVFTCRACHDNRGKAIYSPSQYGDLMSSYVDGGFMPPNIPAYETDPKQVQKNLVPLLTRKSAAQCFEKDVRARVIEWLEAPACN